jgi:hypothetical protein
LPVLAGFLSGDLKISRVNRGSPMRLSADDIFSRINIENRSFRGKNTRGLMKNVCYLSEQVLKIKNKINVKMKKKTDTRRVCGYGSHKSHDIGLNQSTYLGAPPI